MDNKKLNISNEVYSPLEDSHLLENEILKLNLKGKVCLDMGTGSGIQGIAMIKAGADFVVCVDINPNALKKAKENIEKYIFENKKDNVKVKYIESNLFEKLKGVKFDFISFNPPYVPTDEIKWADLDGGKDGRVVIDHFILQFQKHLIQNGTILLLLSSLNFPDEITFELKERKYLLEIIAKKKLFFEELIVVKITN